MRNTAVFGVMVTGLVAGCFNPRIVDAGFQCDPSVVHPCPDGYLCRDYGSGSFLCTTSTAQPAAMPDLAMSSGGGSGGGGGGGGDVDMAMPPGGQDLAMAPPDLMPPPNNCTASSLLINEVRTGSTASAKEEWVEIYNPCANTLSLSNAKLVYRSDTNSGSTDTSTLATIPSASIAGGAYYLIANSGYAGTADLKPFDSTSVGMADGGGGVGLRDSGGTLLTSMGWGTANNTFQQGSAATAEATGKSIARQPNGANTHHDSVDFKSSTPTPGAAN